MRLAEVPEELKAGVISHLHTVFSIRHAVTPIEYIPPKPAWVTVPVNNQDVAEAQNRYKALELSGASLERNYSKYRWVGQLGEIALDRWLCSTSVPFVWNNKHGDHGGSDFIILDTTVDVKASDRSRYPDNHWTVGMSDFQKTRGKYDDYFFCLYMKPPADPEVILIGGLDRIRFNDTAVLSKKNEQLHKDMRVSKTMWNVTITDPTKPHQWLQKITGKPCTILNLI
ncbi:MAG: hypothetical protein V3S33_02235 [Gammaproteobacteria bacterium]